MGCSTSVPHEVVFEDPDLHRLCKLTKNKYTSLGTFESDKSFFYKDQDNALWKIRKHKSAQEVKELYYNNMRAFLLPRSQYLLKPTAILKLSRKSFAVKMQHGDTDLFEYIDKDFKLNDVAKALHEISQSILWLHDHCLAHRDIKPENIVMHNGRWKLIDFDFCSPLEEFVHCGTHCFICKPEITNTWSGSASDASKRADVYAFGKTIFMCLWKAAELNYIKQRRVLWVMFHNDFVLDIQMKIEPEWQPWLDVAMKCCAKQPPTRIPTLPTTMIDTIRTVDTIARVTTIQMVDTDPTLTETTPFCLI